MIAKRLASQTLKRYLLFYAELSSFRFVSVPDYFADDAEEAFELLFDGEGAFPTVAVCWADLYAAAVEPVYALDGNVFVVAVFNENGVSVVYFFGRVDEQPGSASPPIIQQTLYKGLFFVGFMCSFFSYIYDHINQPHFILYRKQVFCYE